jgi:hypothetical protein
MNSCFRSFSELGKLASSLDAAHSTQKAQVWLECCSTHFSCARFADSRSQTPDAGLKAGLTTSEADWPAADLGFCCSNTVNNRNNDQ